MDRGTDGVSRLNVFRDLDLIRQIKGGGLGEGMAEQYYRGAESQKSN